MSELLTYLFGLSAEAFGLGWFWLIPVVLAILIIIWKFKDFKESSFLQASLVAGISLGALIGLPFALFFALMFGASAENTDHAVFLIILAILILEIMAILAGFALAVCLVYPAYKIYKKSKKD